LGSTGSPANFNRREHANGVVTFESVALRATGVFHGFGTRLGGVSAPPFDSLDCDITRDNAANHTRLHAAIGCANLRSAWVHQCHGRDAVIVDATTVDAHPQADALITSDPSVVLSIRTADCVPVLLATRDGRVVAAAHAGWRGLVAGVIPNTIRMLTASFGIDTNTLVAAVGPSVGVVAYEVSGEVARAFTDIGLHDVVRHDLGPKEHLDLPLAATLQLRAAGIPEDSIDVHGGCTFTDATHFFSHRRDRDRAGRMASVIRTRP